MKGDRDMFYELSQLDIDVEVVLGDDTVVREGGRGTITFQRESTCPMILIDVLFVPGMKKNLISVSMIKDRGLGVSFQDGHLCFSQDCRTICFIHHWSQMWETVQALVSAPACFGT